MTEHPAAPTPEDETWIDLTIAMRAYMQDRNGWGAVEDAMRARDDFHRAEARAAARKEVRPAMWELVHDAAHAGNGYYETCMECMRSVDAILDSLSTDTREATDVSE